MRVITDVEFGMAAGFGQRLRAEQAEAQVIINRVHGRYLAEKAARQNAEAALKEANQMIATLQRHLAEVDAALAGR
jgi:hypothetical protein